VSIALTLCINDLVRRTPLVDTGLGTKITPLKRARFNDYVWCPTSHWSENPAFELVSEVNVSRV